MSNRYFCQCSKLSDDLLSACCTSDIPLLPVYLQCVLMTTLLLPFGPCLLVLVVLAAGNAVPLSCGLCHMCCCVRCIQLFGSLLWLLHHVLPCALPMQMALMALMDNVFFFPISFNVCTSIPGSSNEVCVVHRVIRWLWLEWTLKVIQFQPPCYG